MPRHAAPCRENVRLLARVWFERVILASSEPHRQTLTGVQAAVRKSIKDEILSLKNDENKKHVYEKFVRTQHSFMEYRAANGLMILEHVVSGSKFYDASGLMSFLAKDDEKTLSTTKKGRDTQSADEKLEELLRRQTCFNDALSRRFAQP